MSRKDGEKHDPKMNRLAKITAETDRLIRSGERKARKGGIYNEIDTKNVGDSSPHCEVLNTDINEKVQVIIERE